MQEYYMKNKSGKIKKGGYKNGRGYCGWYTNNDGKKLYLRSKIEFIYAKYLDATGHHFLAEKKVFEIKNKFYKPDFFIYDANYAKLLKIIEIKYSKKEADQYNKEFYNFFAGIGIDYEVKYDIKKIQKQYVSKKDIDGWVQSFVNNYNRISMAGKNNPMFGMHHSEKTKKLIGERTKQYMKNPEIKKKHSEARKNYWRSEEGDKCKLEYAKLRNQEKAKRVAEKSIKCKLCKNKFYPKNKKNVFCSPSCSSNFFWKNTTKRNLGDKKKAYKTRLVNSGKIISLATAFDYESKIKEAKEKGLIPKHFGMSIKVVEKYFGDINLFLKEINHGKTC